MLGGKDLILVKDGGEIAAVGMNFVKLANHPFGQEYILLTAVYPPALWGSA